MVVTELGIVTLVKEIQLEKAPIPIIATESGIDTLVNEPQLSKAPCPIVVTDLGIMMLVNELQFEKAPFPIIRTEQGIVMLVKELQFEKVLFLICVTEFGIVTLVSALQFEKALWPITVTELGIVMLINELQFSKALFPIIVTELGTDTVVKELQFSKAPCPISVTELGMITRATEQQSLKTPEGTARAPCEIFTFNCPEACRWGPPPKIRWKREHSTTSNCSVITICTKVSGESPAEVTVSESFSSFFWPTKRSTKDVMLLITFPCCFSTVCNCSLNSPTVVEGQTSSARVSPPAQKKHSSNSWSSPAHGVSYSTPTSET